MSFSKSFQNKKYLDGTFLPIFFARDDDDLGIGDILSLIKAVELSSSLGHNIIEVLPINFSSAFESPYSVLSTRCFNTIYISIKMALNLIPCAEAESLLKNKEEEVKQLKKSKIVVYQEVRDLKDSILKIIFKEFLNTSKQSLKKNFDCFIEENKHWLEDHLLFIILRNQYLKENPHTGWDFRSWPAKVKMRDSETILELKKKWKEEIFYQSFLQWLFWEQWNELKKKACENEVFLMGDIPFSVDGADIWIQPEVFGLKAPDFRRNFTQGVPPDFFSKTGQYWQFYPFDWENKKSETFVLERLKWNQKLFDIIRLDHVLGYYRSYLFFEDPYDKTNFESLKIWETMRHYIDLGKNDYWKQGDYAWEVYKTFLDTLRTQSEQFFPLKIDDFFSPKHRYLLKEDHMLLIAKETTGEKLYHWDRQYSVEKAIFQKKPYWDFLKISKEKNFQDHERLSGYLFSNGEDKPDSSDSLRPCFFAKGPGEKLMEKFLSLAKEKDQLIISEALGIVPEFVTASLKKIDAYNYIPLIYGITPDDTGNPYFPDNHDENAFVTFALHDSETLYGWWSKKNYEEKQKILDYLFGPEKESAANNNEVSFLLHKALLSKVYESKSRIKVLLWTDILLTSDEERINQPGNQWGQWVARMPEEVSLDNLLRVVKGSKSTDKSYYVINLIKSLKTVKNDC